MTDATKYRVSDGILVSPFLDTAVAVDLVTERAHVLGPAAAWLLSQDSPVEIASLAASVAGNDQNGFAETILDALDTLRTPGLVDRDVAYEFPEPPGEAGGSKPGTHTGRTHAVIDRRIAFRSDDLGLLERIDAFLGPGVNEPATRFFDVIPADDGQVKLYAADKWVFANETRMFFQLPAVLNDDGARTHGVIVIHSGTVRTPKGRIIVLTGPSNAGKSTLTGALVAAGCDYLGDESIGITDTGSVLGYPKPLTLSAESRKILGLEPSESPHLRAIELRSDVEEVIGAPRVDEILLVRYDAEYTSVSLGDRLEPRVALEAVFENILNIARAGESGLAALCNLVESVPVRRLVHSGVQDAVSAILDADRTH